MIHTSAVDFWPAIGRIHELQAPRSEHTSPGESELPSEWQDECQMASIDKHMCIDKSESNNMYWKSCPERRHTRVGNETTSIVNVTKLII